MKTYEVKAILIEPHKGVMLHQVQREAIELSAKEGVDVIYEANGKICTVVYKRLFDALDTAESKL